MRRLQRIVKASSLTTTELSNRLDIAQSTLSLKLSGARGWDPAEVVVLSELLCSARWHGKNLNPGLKALCLMCGKRTSDLM